ncbi:MAG: hypothetical protein AB7F40_00335 [Victivallaceae bacterium]|nr:hypothetical protein [Victivallaceae bacterium]
MARFFLSVVTSVLMLAGYVCFATDEVTPNEPETQISYPLDNVSFLAATEGAFMLMRQDGLSPTPFSENVIGDVTTIYMVHQWAPETELTQYDHAFVELTDLISQEKLISPADTKSFPTLYGLFCLRELLPEAVGKKIVLPSSFNGLPSLGEPPRKEEVTTVANYISYIFPYTFCKKIEVLKNEAKGNTAENNHLMYDIALYNLRFAAQYQLLSDPSLERFIDQANNRLFIEFIEDHWPGISAASKERICTDPVIKVWLSKWEEKVTRAEHSQP